MATSIEQLIGALLDILRLLSDSSQRIREAALSWDRAAVGYASTLQGSRHPAEQDLRAMAVSVRRQIDELMALIRSCETRIDAVVRNYGGGNGPVPSSTAPPKRPLDPSPMPIDDKRIEEIRRGMRSPSPRRAQTTGWVIHSDGSRDRVLSGPDDDPGGLVRTAEDLVRGHLPPNSHGAVALARHVEVKVAMRMRRENLDQMVLVVDKKVCGRTPETAALRYQCDRYLPFFIPRGAVLTVIEHDGTRVDYRGRGPR